MIGEASSCCFLSCAEVKRFPHLYCYYYLFVVVDSCTTTTTKKKEGSRQQIIYESRYHTRIIVCSITQTKLWRVFFSHFHKRRFQAFRCRAHSLSSSLVCTYVLVFLFGVCFSLRRPDDTKKKKVSWSIWKLLLANTWTGVMGESAACALFSLSLRFMPRVSPFDPSAYSNTQLSRLNPP